MTASRLLPAHVTRVRFSTLIKPRVVLRFSALLFQSLNYLRSWSLFIRTACDARAEEKVRRLTRSLVAHCLLIRGVVVRADWR